MKEVIKAILTHAKSGGTASDLYEGVSSDFYYGQAPPDTKMPYITFHMISDLPVHTFRQTDTSEEVVVQFSIFDDDDSSPENIEDLADKLVTAFDRAVLSYDTRSPIGCLRESGTGPTRLEDCWLRTIDYRVMYV